MESRNVQHYPNINTCPLQMTMLVVVLVLALVARSLWRSRRQPPSTSEAPPTPGAIRAAGPYL